MEQHPVPQNVTTFQFRLIGDMTIKQFGYLAGGAILGYICYKLPLPFFFTYPLAFVSVLAGFGFAFVPIEERPMDVWVVSFIKSIYSPTQYIWQKTKPTPVVPPRAAPHPVKKRGLFSLRKPLPLSPQPHEKESVVAGPTLATQPPKTHRSVGEILANLFAKPHAPKSLPHTAPAKQPPERPLVLTQHVSNPFWWLRRLLAGKKPSRFTQAPGGYPDVFASHVPQEPVTGRRPDMTPPPQVVQPATPTAQPNEEDTKLKAHALRQQIDILQKELETKSLSESRILELQKQLTEVLNQRNALEQELLLLRQKLGKQPTLFRPMAVAMPQAPTKATVKVITPDTAVRAGLPKLTTFPNVVTGIIKDNEGNLLPGVLITVRDKDDIPVRALKTNKLGQFAASTPLTNGVYVVEVEDPRDRFGFDRAQITVTGTVMPPLEIIAKTKKELERDRLAREIFGTPQI